MYDIINTVKGIVESKGAKIMPRKYSNEYKKMVLDEAEKVGSITKIAKKYKLNSSLVYRWKKLHNDEGNVQLKLIEDNIDEKRLEVHKNAEYLANENLQLKDLILKKEIEVQKLKDILRGLI